MALIYPHKQAGDGTFLLCKCKCKCEVHVTSVGFTLVLVDGGNTAPAKRQGRTLQIEKQTWFLNPHCKCLMRKEMCSVSFLGLYDGMVQFG